MLFTEFLVICISVNLNPVNRNIKIQILPCFPYMFSIEVVGRINFVEVSIRFILVWCQFSWPLCFIKQWYYKEKIDTDHSYNIGIDCDLYR